MCQLIKTVRDSLSPPPSISHQGINVIRNAAKCVYAHMVILGWRQFLVCNNNGLIWVNTLLLFYCLYIGNAVKYAFVNYIRVLLINQTVVNTSMAFDLVLSLGLLTIFTEV